MHLCAWERRHADPQNPTQPATQKKEKKKKKERKRMTLHAFWLIVDKNL